MTHLHLSEEDVQLAAMDKFAVADPSWQDCAACQERVEAYQLVFSSLSRLVPERPGFDLEAAVMSSLPERVKPLSTTRQPMYTLPIWVGSLAFFAVAGIALAALRGYFAGIGTWVSAIALVTVPGVALWMAFDIIHDHRRKLRSLGLK